MKKEEKGTYVCVCVCVCVNINCLCCGMGTAVDCVVLWGHELFVSVVLSGCVLGSGPAVLSSSPTQAIFPSDFPSASHQPHQSTQL